MLHRTVFALLLAFIGNAGLAEAQHPVDVERKAASGDYLGALTAFDQLPRRQVTLSAQLAAARSAWALSLSARARELIDRALQDSTLQGRRRVQALFSRAAIEYQDHAYQVAILFAERAYDAAEPGPLRARILSLWGESLYALNSYGAAEERYAAAIAEAAAEDLPDLHYLRGRTLMRLGRGKDAIASFEQVPLGHDRTPQALRALAQLSLDEGRYEAVSFWLQHGREHYPQQFLDSWVDYALLVAALRRGAHDEAGAVLRDAQGRLPASDPWLTLASAAFERSKWVVNEQRAHS